MTYFTVPGRGREEHGTLGSATDFTLKLVNKTMVKDVNILNVDGLFRKD